MKRAETFYVWRRLPDGYVHTVEEYTRFRLFSRLRVHGIGPVVLGRRVKK